MKKTILSLCLTALIGLASCGGTGSKLNQYEEALKSYIELANQGKFEEAQKEGEKAAKLLEEIKKENLNEEQQRKLAEITLKYGANR